MYMPTTKPQCVVSYNRAAELKRKSEAHSENVI